MCGINGVFGHLPNQRETLDRMNSALSHRGPNAEGTFVTESIALGHRRLSIIDLSDDANQPMGDASGRYTIVFNGEIYNYQELRSQLASYPFRTKSDTEVLLAGLISNGMQFIKSCNGMFAFAFWDEEEQRLLIGRDRMGIKPLYYARVDNSFIFSSEIRAIIKSGLMAPRLNISALPEYIRYQTVHGDNTILEGVYSLHPGCCIEITQSEDVMHTWWHPTTHYNRDVAFIGVGEIHALIRQKLEQAVRRRLVADVPFGAFLSGGIDSSAVVGLASGLVTQPLRTFTVSFQESTFSEASHAAAIARRFGTNHTEIMLHASDLLRELPDALASMDHPGGDGINTYVVSRAAKEAGITMVLSGLGGDELFAGYPVFTQISELQKNQWLLSFPKFARSLAGRAMVLRNPGNASEKTASVLKQDRFDVEYAYQFSREVVSETQVAQMLRSTAGSIHEVFKIAHEGIGYGKPGYSLPLLGRISYAELSTYLQSVLLRDADQMGMANALEIRVPFLDHELVETVLGIPDILKYPHTPKKLLTDALEGLLPPSVTTRPKMGFTFPWDAWMRAELRDWCGDHMLKLSQRAPFHRAEVQKRWDLFLSGHPSVTWSRIWYLCVLENWLSRNGVEA